MIRFSFSIRTRMGQRVDNISIMAGSESDAERRLRQMYHQCEILECHTQAVPRRIDTLDVEGVIELITSSDPPASFDAANDAPVNVFRLRHKAGAH